MTTYSSASSSGSSSAVAPAPINDRTWIIVFVSGFLGLMVDGMDLMFLSYSLPSLMKDMAISKVQAGSLGSYSLLGMAIGGLFGGWAADRFGRVRTVMWTIVVFSVGTAALGLTQNYWQFAIVRFISALGLGAEYVACNTLMAEYVPIGAARPCWGHCRRAGLSDTSLLRSLPGSSSQVWMALAVCRLTPPGRNRFRHPQIRTRVAGLAGSGSPEEGSQAGRPMESGFVSTQELQEFHSVDPDCGIYAIRPVRYQQLAAHISG